MGQKPELILFLQKQKGRDNSIGTLVEENLIRTETDQDSPSRFWLKKKSEEKYEPVKCKEEEKIQPRPKYISVGWYLIMLVQELLVENDPYFKCYSSC